MKNTATKLKYGWVVWVPQYSEYVYYVGGDWGPSYLTTPNLIEASIFPDEKTALKHAQEWDGLLKKVSETTTIELELI